MDKSDRKVETSVNMRSYVFERSYKRPIVTDTKLRNASNIFRSYYLILILMAFYFILYTYSVFFLLIKLQISSNWY